MAWEATDTPTAELPLISAADFSSADRIKAWGICDYLLRRDPTLLSRLDRTRGSRNANEVRTQFAETSDGQQLDALDEDWRRFWTADSQVRHAVLGGGDALDATSRDAPDFLAAFNELREQLDREPVVWSAEYLVACKQHAEYLRANRRARGPVAEHTQELGQDGASGAGRSFAARALVATKARDAEDAIASWLHLPGYRDALLDPSLQVVGIYAARGIVVMDVIRGRGRTTQVVHFPNGLPPGSAVPQSARPSLVVPHAIDVDELGPEVAAALRAAGLRRPRTVGYPLSLHFFQPGALPAAAALRCDVKRDDRKAVAGVVVVADDGRSRRSAAPGLVVFYPLEPLERGSPYTVQWSYRKGDNQRELKKHQFFTR